MNSEPNEKPAPPTTQQKFDAVKEKVCVCGGGLELRPGSFGLGLFATKTFLKGEPITLYGGQLVSHSEAQKRSRAGGDSHMRRHIAMHCCFDGCFMPDGTKISDPTKQLVGFPVGAFCNDTSDAGQLNARFNYIDSQYNEDRFKEFEKGYDYRPKAEERLTFIEAIRDIKPDEEIFVDYGSQYWANSKEKKKRKQEGEALTEKKAKTVQE